jgi:hypothetical protein
VLLHSALNATNTDMLGIDAETPRDADSALPQGMQQTTALEKRIVQNTAVYCAKRTTRHGIGNAMYEQSMQRQQS